MNKEMQILDIIADYSETQEVFAEYDEIAGKCVVCNHMFDTLEEFAIQYEIDLQELISKLNKKINR